MDGLALLFPSSLQAVIVEFLEAGIILHSLSAKYGEKVFFNSKRMIRHFGFFETKTIPAEDASFPIMRTFRVEENELYCLHEDVCHKLVDTAWVQVGSMQNINDCSQRCMHQGELYSLNCFSQIVHNGYSAMIGCGNRLYFYSAHILDCFDLQTNTSIECSKPPIKLFMRFCQHTYTVFDGCLYFFGVEYVQIYHCDSDVWSLQKHSKLPKHIIGCTVFN
jgi:hypothetical protein